jgi:hypothetical protein
MGVCYTICSPDVEGVPANRSEPIYIDYPELSVYEAVVSGDITLEGLPLYSLAYAV